MKHRMRNPRSRILPGPKPWLALMLATIVLALPVLDAAAQLAGMPEVPSLAPVIDRIGPAVVNISVRGSVEVENPLANDPFFRRFFGVPPGNNGRREFQSAGSGVIVDAAAGYILTNHHVVENADEITITLVDNRSLEARVVGSDPGSDIAVLQVDPDDLAEMSLGNSDQVRVGDFVLAIGNPFGLQHTVTSGIVSAIGRRGIVNPEGYEDFIQTDASINPGNSGGPLFDQHGRVIGIATAIFSQSGGNIGIGFATPINLARAVVDQLRASGKVVRGWLGVSIQPLSPELRAALGLGDLEGALVADVFPDSPAARGGLQRGDVVIGLDGKPVTDPGILSRTIAMMRPGADVNLTVIRDGKRRALDIEIGTLPDDDELAARPDPQRGAAPPGSNLGRLGLALDDLSDAARRQLGYSHEVRGALITGVASGSPADTAGLRPGDVILQVDRTAVSSPREADRAIASSDPPILLLVRRGDSTVFLTLTPRG